jgi:hypothetical protein
MESARRWSGFVCPDCRFVFRVPRDHDGKGVVCPSCRRMLRIPAAGDRPAPLVVPLTGPVLKEEPAADEPQQDSNKRRKRKARKSDNHSWDSSSGRRRRSGHGEKRQMFWMLVGGATVFVLIVAGVMVAMRGGESPPQALAAVNHPVPAPGPLPEANATEGHRSDAEFTALAEPLARMFLDARRVEDLLAVVRNPESAAKRMKRHYPDGTVDAPGLADFNLDSLVTYQGNAALVRIRTRKFDEKSIAFVETPAGLKIDWESWAGWSDLSWEEFLASKPVAAKSFRVFLSDVDYYNMAFTDDVKWQCYRLESPDGENSVYGYAERGSELNSRLRPPPDSKRMPVTLSLRFPDNANSRDQVLIGGIVSESWVIETEEPP